MYGSELRENVYNHLNGMSHKNNIWLGYMRSNIIHMSGLLSSLKTNIYYVYVYVPAGNKHVYTVQLSCSSFLRQKLKANAFLYTVSQFTLTL